MKNTKKIKSIPDLEQVIENQINIRKAEKKSILTVSAGTCGQARGSLKVIECLEKIIKKGKLEDKVKVKITGCHGFCEAEPNIIIHPKDIFYQKVQPVNAKEIISETILNDKVIESLLFSDLETGEIVSQENDIPFYKKQRRIILGDNALIDPTDINDYLSIGGYSSLVKVLKNMSPGDVIETLKLSGLRGRGGAGFPTGDKWEFTRKAKGETKYIICNADEGDPGAYMDRSLLEGNPHRVLEGMIIGAFAIGAEEGYIYVRDEYPLAVDNITIAISQAEEIGLLGEKILGTDFNFQLHIVKGAGAFVCGEETALIASAEGKLGEPRQRPPFPAVKGLWGKPTNINNVETWANIPIITDKGADWFSQIGTNGSKGTKIFSLVGKINNTGLVEVPMGITLREVIFEIGGGIPGGNEFKAVQTGGPSGGCIPKEKLDLPIDFESLTKAGSIMGSGGMIIMDENTCMVDIAKFFLNFLRDESCGKCISCREGTQRMWEIVRDISEGKGKEGDIELLEELAKATKGASMCGLGQTAANPVLSTLRYFKEEYEDHIKYKKCPALVCKEIVSSPCQYICPINQEASVYIALIAQGKFEEALNIIRKDNPLPSVCGRVCHHPCEKVCRAGEIGEPIAIRALKRFVIDWTIERDYPSPNQKKKPKRKNKVAIIGAGPAGLTAGYYLNQKGYPITIFESLPVPGGMLAIGIPDHRLPKDVLNFDIENIKKSGVTIKTNTTLGKDFSIDDLFKEGYKAIFIATGAHKSMEMKIPGEDAEGVIQAMKLLKTVNLGKEAQLGEKVGVIGGGNAAIDAARVAIRNKKTKKVSILYRRTRKEMPAFEEEIDSAIEEGVEIQFLVTPIKVLTQNGRLVGVECIRMKLGDIDASGRRRPVPIEDTEFKIELDTLVPAIGERPDISFLTDKDDLKISKWRTIEVDKETLKTNRDGVFSGGDAVTGPRTVVEAMAAGKTAAKSIENYIEKKRLIRKYKLTRPSVYFEPVELTEEEIERAKRPKMPKLSVKQRKKNFNEVELGLNNEMVIKEARRCLRCELETEEGKKAIGRQK
ncbi:MAG: NADH-quinone oxidoreductase subunit NuoF [Candidatus Aminicenantes bacterium]|nr:MAG: NADH-quinone oxidoreductase subunit NuoF [Candidatus Aminicenantes bacterium]